MANPSTYQTCERFHVHPLCSEKSSRDLRRLYQSTNLISNHSHHQNTAKNAMDFPKCITSDYRRKRRVVHEMTRYSWNVDPFVFFLIDLFEMQSINAVIDPKSEALVPIGINLICPFAKEDAFSEWLLDRLLETWGTLTPSFTHVKESLCRFRITARKGISSSAPCNKIFHTGSQFVSSSMLPSSTNPWWSRRIML